MQPACCCCGQTEETKRNVKLTFLRDELLYAVADPSYVEGDLLHEVDEEHVRHLVTDIVQEVGIDRVTRVLDMAHAECVEMLYPYSKQEIPEEQEPLDDKLTETEVYEIDLTLPANFSFTTVKLLEKLIHEYLVARVLADWMSITKPNSEANWEKKFTLLREKIRTCLTTRTGRVRRRLQPF